MIPKNYYCLFTEGIPLAVFRNHVRYRDQIEFESIQAHHKGQQTPGEESKADH